MAILQEQPPDPAAPSQIAAASLKPPQDLEYPHAPIPAKVGDSRMPLILWSMAILLGILMLLVRTPLHAPPFESLTEYACDPLPLLPKLGNRYQRYQLNLRCRAGDQVIFQRQSPYAGGTNSSGVNACYREGGLTRIWRVAAPSAYGAYVFQSTCGDHLIAAYKNRIALRINATIRHCSRLHHHPGGSYGPCPTAVSRSPTPQRYPVRQIFANRGDRAIIHHNIAPGLPRLPDIIPT